ncbi:hypothetical protein LCGC14_2861270 [marine sediment metagenome]|uniref:Uncharacterized protein n=2 Tax=marine sediment metagenome TaxID=412755 RepID=A0A0F8YSA7_9ZZZZ
MLIILLIVMLVNTAALAALLVGYQWTPKEEEPEEIELPQEVPKELDRPLTTELEKPVYAARVAAGSNGELVTEVNAAKTGEDNLVTLRDVREAVRQIPSALINQ